MKLFPPTCRRNNELRCNKRGGKEVFIEPNEESRSPGGVCRIDKDVTAGAVFKGWITANLRAAKVFPSTLFGDSIWRPSLPRDAQLAAPVRSALGARRNSLLSHWFFLLPRKMCKRKIWTAFKTGCQRLEGTWRAFYHSKGSWLLPVYKHKHCWP